MYPEPDETTKMRKNNNSYGGNSYFLLIIRKADNGSVLVIILQGNIFVELRTNLYLCRRRLISWGEYGTTVKEEKR